MHELQAMDLARRSILIALQLSLPILLLSLVVGVIVSLVSGRDADSGADADVRAQDHRSGAGPGRAGAVDAAHDRRVHGRAVRQPADDDPLGGFPMFDLAAFSADSFWAFLQVFARVSALFVTAPVFGSREIPTQVKAGLAGHPVAGPAAAGQDDAGATVPATVFGMAAMLLGQALIGLLIGLVVSLLFVAVRIGGDLIDYQMGFTQAATFNPQFNETVSPIAELSVPLRPRAVFDRQRPLAAAGVPGAVVRQAARGAVLARGADRDRSPT